MRRFLFIPFSEKFGEHPGELEGWARAWASFYLNKKDFTIIKYVPFTDCLAEVDGMSQLYILGHTKPGTDYILDLLPEGKRLFAVNLANRIKAARLPESFWGRITVYGCSSGARGPLEDKSNDSFAKKLADLLRAKGYTNCKYFGYLHTLVSPESFEKYGGKYAEPRSKLERELDILLAQMKGMEGEELTAHNKTFLIKAKAARISV
jgi:hypothetical protein